MLVTNSQTAEPQYTKYYIKNCHIHYTELQYVKRNQPQHGLKSSHFNYINTRGEKILALVD